MSIKFVSSFILAFALFANSKPTFAAPTITNVTITGGIANGSSGVVDGSSLGTKSPAKPYVFAAFNSGSTSPDSDGTRTSWDEVLKFSYTTACGRTTTGCLVGTWTTADSTTKWHELALVKVDTFTVIYTNFKRKLTSAPSANQKLWRAWRNTDGSGGTPILDFVSSTDGGGKCFNEINTLQPDRNQSFPAYTHNVYHNEQHIWTHGAATVISASNDGDGIWEYRIDNSAVQVSTRMFNGDNEIKHLKVVENFTDAADLAPDGTQVYVDDVYGDITTARVMLCNAATYAAATVCEVQIPTAWSSTQVSFTFRLGDFLAADNMWLYVFDGTIPAGSRDSTPNTNGFSLASGVAGLSVVRPTVPFTLSPR